MFDGVRYTADEQGLVRLSLNTPQPATHRLSLVDVMMHQQRRDLTFVRWWYVGDHDQDHRTTITGIKVRRHVRIKAAFRATYKVSYSFVDPAQGPVDHERVKRVEFYGDNGQTVAGDGSGTLRLVGIQAKVSSGTLVAKQVSYTVQRVDVDGSNVVQMSHQTFVPEPEGDGGRAAAPADGAPQHAGPALRWARGHVGRADLPRRADDDGPAGPGRQGHRRRTWRGASTPCGSMLPATRSTARWRCRATSTSTCRC